ncbi:MAG: pyridoxal-dependent decarboxylase [Bacteroidota bacterium]
MIEMKSLIEMNPNSTSIQRNEVVQSLINELEKVYNNPRTELEVSKAFNIDNVKADVQAFSLNQANDIKAVMLHTIEGIKKHGVQVTHPSYLGLFNPRPNFPSVMADVINSYLNPQLAAWSHAPYAVEIERLVIKEFCQKFGYPEGHQDGTFCTGGAESNLTAVLCALRKSFPDISENGIASVDKLPTIYCSSESHHSIEKAAKIVGLGKRSVIKIPVNEDLTMDVNALRRRIELDRKNNLKPFLVVGTAGTTGAGAVDDLLEISCICKEAGLWFHVDAAYGGGAIITEYKDLMEGIEYSDSITLDMHKFFSVPMATSVFLTSDTTILHQTFGVHTAYMPQDGDPNEVIDPYVHSMQWSRRFIGLKIYLPLAVFGWEGYSKILTHQFEMGNTARKLLKAKGWTIENQSQFPIICFTHPDIAGDDKLVQDIVDHLNLSGKTWMSSYPIDGRLTLRIQIANYETQVEDLVEFVVALSDILNEKLLALKSNVNCSQQI